MTASTSPAADADWALHPALWAHLGRRTGLDLSAYKSSQLVRRLMGFARAEGFDNPSALVRALDGDPGLAARLRHHLTIHVTGFFRDPAYWTALKQAVASDPRPGPWRVWSAAASTGAEALSLIALFDALGRPVQVWATDVDAAVLAQAEAGRYPAAALEGLSAEEREALFEPEGDQWRVREAVRRRIRYQVHDLLGAVYPSERFDLIACRNVLIYFQPEDRLRVVRRLAACLQPGGWFFVGATEVLLDPGQFQLEPVSPSLYRRRADGPGSPP
ncbi:MAG: protein-glutamate O-methyltransferase CheR [Firmicutes bacterium]|nr:protein-glutamate O-methyltransferase CheR [Alicyclobacillaceae bacterium]MCL6498066.1 protein-glutamate O-methyltransferase CheR [Bacillota bacterium]